MKNTMIITEEYTVLGRDKTYFTKAFLAITKYSLFIFFSWYYVSTIIKFLN
jgi:hypothetical protein